MIASRHKMELVVLHCKPLARGLSDQHNPKHGNEWISVPKISTLFPRIFVRTSTQYTYMRNPPGPVTEEDTDSIIRQFFQLRLAFSLRTN